MASISIDPEFAALIPPLSPDELRELEANLVEHGGARDPLIVWDRGKSQILLDGHNRLEICTRLGLPYSVEKLQFADREQARIWMERNQLGRRNLTRDDFRLVLGRLYNRMKRPVGGRPDNPSPERTRERLAKEFGVDARTVDRAGAFQLAAEKLGIEREIARGSLRVSRPQLVAAAKSVSENPTREQVSVALRLARKSKQSTKGTAQSWLVPAEPTDCLKAIRFYATTFAVQYPGSIDALNNLLRGLLEENRSDRPNHKEAR